MIVLVLWTGSWIDVQEIPRYLRVVLTLMGSGLSGEKVANDCVSLPSIHHG
jgi:hypothetical protein